MNPLPRLEGRPLRGNPSANFRQPTSWWSMANEKYAIDAWTTEEVVAKRRSSGLKDVGSRVECEYEVFRNDRWVWKEIIQVFEKLKSKFWPMRSIICTFFELRKKIFENFFSEILIGEGRTGRGQGHHPPMFGRSSDRPPLGGIPVWLEGRP